MSLTTPLSVQKLQTALHDKAKGSPNFRFYALYDKVYREDVMAVAYDCCKANRGAAGVDGAGTPAPGAVKAVPALTLDKAQVLIAKGVPAKRNVEVTARFQVGQQVRARNINPVGHTRLPRYARGKIGRIDRIHGDFVFPDTNAHFLGEKPQHVYSVRFSARELWGLEASAKDSVYLDLWDDYLDAA